MSRRWRLRAPAIVLALALTAAPAAAQVPTPTPPQTIAGPGAGPITLGGLSIARDGSGVLVYLASAGGTEHVFVSRLLGGNFTAPQELDAGLAGPSSQPVAAAGQGGVALVAFVNAGTLYVTDATGATAPFGALQPLASGASNPALSMSIFDKGYLAFAAADGAGSDVRAAYYVGGAWSLVPGALNATAADDAGTGAGRPAVVAAGDGVGIVTWGEGGHIEARRVWGTSPSVLVEQIDPPSVDGAPEQGADSPAISAGGDSSYADIAFREQVDSGGQTQTRVMLGRLVAESVVPAAPIDGLSGTPGSAGSPTVVMNEYGRGFGTAVNTATNDLLATTLTTNGGLGGAATVNPGPNAVAPDPAAGVAGVVSTVLAWQQASGGSGPQVELSYAPDGMHPEAPLTVSTPAAGPVQAADGLAADGDGEGDAAAAWVQGDPASPSLEVAQLLAGPGQAAPTTRTVYTRQTQPVLTWSTAREQWGSLSYTVTLDGQALPPTAGTSLTPPAPLIDGPHVWRVQATNRAGLTSTGPAATVFVDTVAPRLRLILSGRPRAHDRLTARILTADLPPAQPGARASGIAKVTVGWGDRTKLQSGPRLRRAVHVYRRPGIYRITVRVADRAGNATSIVRYLRILR